MTTQEDEPRAGSRARGVTAPRLATSLWSAAVAVVLCLLFAAAAEAGWQRQFFGPQGQDKGFLGISAVAPDFAVAAGVITEGGQDRAVVYIARDGQTWADSSPPPGGPMDIRMFLSAWFADREKGYVGDMGRIWTTADGGSTWTKVALGGLMSGKMITSITGLRPSGPAWAACGNGELLRTDDGGATWPVVAQPLGEAGLGKVVFVDATHGWVASGSAVTDEETGEVTGYEDGGLALTTDGGGSWQTVFSGEARQVSSLRFLDRSRGFMVSRSMAGSALERTEDGGLSWQPMNVPTESAAGPVKGVYDVHFFDACEGWLLGAVGANDAGGLWRTRDGGESWEEVGDREFLGLGKVLGMTIEAKLVAFEFVNREVGWASGNYETLFRYDADDEAGECDDPGPIDGDGGPDDGDGGSGAGGGSGGRCECQAASAAPVGEGITWLAAIGAATWLARRRWRS